MGNYIQISNKEGLIRDMSSGAVININRSEYDNYVQKRRLDLMAKEQVDKNSKDIEALKQDLQEIKTLLISLVNKDK